MQYHDIEIISDERKAFYIKGMQLRFDNILLPAYKQNKEMEK